MCTRLHITCVLAIVSGVTLASALSADDLQQGPTPPEPQTATLVIRLPANADLYVRGQKIVGAGSERKYQSPPLSPEKKYSYLVKIVWSAGGRQQSLEQRVPVRAGQEARLDFLPKPTGPLVDPPPKEQPDPPPPVEETAAGMTADEQAILALVNKERAKTGAKPLVGNGRLTAAARGHSANMAKQQKLDHTLDGKQFFERVSAAGYRGGAAGENIAYGARTAAEVMSMWMNSPGHKSNILNAEYIEIGIGIAASQDGTRYYTQVFAVPVRE